MFKSIARLNQPKSFHNRIHTTKALVPPGRKLMPKQNKASKNIYRCYRMPEEGGGSCKKYNAP